MTAIKRCKDYAGGGVLLVTHERAVRDDNGTTLETKLQMINENSIDFIGESDSSSSSSSSEEELVDELQDLRASLYQSLTDAQQATANAKADYIGQDNYVYRWNPQTGQYQKTNQYVKGSDGQPGTTDYTQLENLPDLKTVATTGSYNDLTDKPDLGGDMEFVEDEGSSWPF